MKRDFDLVEYFKNPSSQRQKQYEVVRAIVLEKQSVETIAKKYHYKRSTIYALLRDAKARKIELFPVVQKGPQQKRTPSNVQQKIIAYRKQRLSTPDIQSCLAQEDIHLSVSTVERILKHAGFGKLKRRTNTERGKTLKNKIIPERAEELNFSELEPFHVDTPVAGVFFFIPYILETGILDIVKECKLPESSVIGSIQACLSMLFFKLIGGKRLSHMGSYDQEPGLGIFAGLNILPKPTYMSTYSCRCSEAQLMDLQNKVVSIFKEKYSESYSGDFINLDF
ncbi:MAG: transposase, partial [Thermodesulfobacteriota bacterium]